MSSFKRFLLLGSISVALLAGLLGTFHSQMSSTAFASGCNTVAQDYQATSSGYYMPYWHDTCTVSESVNPDSNAVFAIQKIINETALYYQGTHCTVGNIDGYFGDNTFKGVKCYQNAYNADTGANISVDGIVGPQTWDALAWSVFSNLDTITTGWNYFSIFSPNTDDFRMWGQSPYKWYVDVGGCWRQMDVNSDSCA